MPEIPAIAAPVKKFAFKMGADPEFNIILQNKRVDARQTLDKILKGKYRRVNDGWEVPGHGAIGEDGASQTGELRVTAEDEPAKLVDHLTHIFKVMAEHLSIFDISTLSTHASIGGHIHFGITQEQQPSMNNEKLTAIHRRLVSFYLPILLSENKTNLALRTQQGYGTMATEGGYRMESHYNHPNGAPGYTFEFRTPSAEWMTTPRVAESTLAYLGVIYHEILNHPRRFAAFSDVVVKSDKMANALQTLAIQEFELITKQTLNKIRQYVKTFELYPLFKTECDYILSVKSPFKDKINAEYNVLKGWGLVSERAKITKKQFMSDATVNKIAESKDIDNFRGFINIHYNKDTKVSNYAEALVTRMAAFNMKFKNTYFLFGTRKGIPSIIARNASGKFFAGKEVIKTVSDAEQIENLFNKVGEKFNAMHDLDDSYQLNVSTGKAENLKDKAIIIGLPYDMRIKNNTKTFLNLIWNIENGKIEPAVISGKTPELIDDRSNSPQDKGQIYKIMNKVEPENVAVIADPNAQSGRNHERAMTAVLEERLEEASEAEALNVDIDRLVAYPISSSTSVNPSSPL